MKKARKKSRKTLFVFLVVKNSFPVQREMRGSKTKKQFQKRKKRVFLGFPNDQQ